MLHFNCRRLVLLLAVLAAADSSRAQSTRPGWGSTPYHDAVGTGVTFRVWAPNATSVYVPGQFNGWSTAATPLGRELTNGVWNGNWSADVTSAAVGQQYKYYLNFTGGSGYISGTSVWRHDPRARKVVSSSTGAGGDDIIYDPAAFNWTNDSPVSPSLNDLVIYKLHIGTFYNPNSGSGLQGKFTDATNRLDYLKNLGVSAVEILPIAEFPGTASWGYNPADIFAADNNSYGGPDGFKTFVKACHARGLAVLLDVFTIITAQAIWTCGISMVGTAAAAAAEFIFTRLRRNAARRGVRGPITAGSRCATSSSKIFRCGSRNVTWTVFAGTRRAR